MTPEQEKEIKKCAALLIAGWTAQDMRDVGYAEGAIREAIKRAVQEGGA